MKTTLSISKTLQRYKDYSEYKQFLLENGMKEFAKTYSFYEIPILKQLASYKSQNPYKFKVACALVKFKLA